MIRPIDLQNTILQSMQGGPAAQRADESLRGAAQAGQAAFAAEVARSDESVASTADVEGNRIGAKPDERRQPAPRKARKRRAPLADPIDADAEAAGDPPHLIDFSA
jgi:hypothetical protein